MMRAVGNDEDAAFDDFISAPKQTLISIINKIFENAVGGNEAQLQHIFVKVFESLKEWKADTLRAPPGDDDEDIGLADAAAVGAGGTLAEEAEDDGIEVSQPFAEPLLTIMVDSNLCLLLRIIYPRAGFFTLVPTIYFPKTILDLGRLEPRGSREREAALGYHAGGFFRHARMRA